MLSVCIRSWWVHSVHALVPDSHAQCTHQLLPRMLRMFWMDLFKFGILRLFWAYTWETDAYAQLKHQFLTHMLRMFLRDLRSMHPLVSDTYAQCMHTSVPDTYAQCMHQFLMHMLRVYKMNIWQMGKLMCMLSMRVRSWCIWWGCASVPDAHTQCMHKFLTLMLSMGIKVGSCA